MSRIYAIITQKGGVGKTTTVNALASSFFKRGFRVLAVDMAPQSNHSVQERTAARRLFLTPLPEVYVFNDAFRKNQ